MSAWPPQGPTRWLVAGAITAALVVVAAATMRRHPPPREPLPRDSAFELSAQSLTLVEREAEAQYSGYEGNPKACAALPIGSTGGETTVWAVVSCWGMQSDACDFDGMGASTTSVRAILQPRNVVAYDEVASKTPANHPDSFERLFPPAMRERQRAITQEEFRRVHERALDRLCADGVTGLPWKRGG